jgi:uncharacterized protein (TIRG00374 family)
MSKRIKYIVLVVGLSVFSYMVCDYGFRNILTNLLDVGWWFVPIVLVWGAVYLCNAQAWFVILREYYPALRFWNIYKLTVTAFALNYITPFLSLGGEPYRVAALKGKVDKHRAISSVILYNMIRWLAHFFFWLFAIVLALVMLHLTLLLRLVLGTITILLFCLAGFFIARHKYGIFESLMSWMEGKRVLSFAVRKLEPHRRALLVIDGQIKELYTDHRRSFYASIGFEFLSRIIVSLEFFFILIALGYTPSYLEALLINAATSFLLNMLFFVPFELGTREGGLLLILQWLGYPAGIGIFIGLANRLREFAWIAIGLLLMLKTEGHEAEKTLWEIMEEDK